MDEYKLRSAIVDKREVWYGEITVPVFLSEIEYLAIASLVQQDAKELYGLDIRLLEEQYQRQWCISIKQSEPSTNPEQAIRRLARGCSLVEKKYWEEQTVYHILITAMTFAWDLTQEHIRIQHEG